MLFSERSAQHRHEDNGDVGFVRDHFPKLVIRSHDTKDAFVRLGDQVEHNLGLSTRSI